MARWEQSFYDFRLRLIGELLPRHLAGKSFRVVRILATFDGGLRARDGEEVVVLPPPEHPVASGGPDIRYEVRDSSGATVAVFRDHGYEVSDAGIEETLAAFLRELGRREKEPGPSDRPPTIPPYARIP